MEDLAISGWQGPPPPYQEVHLPLGCLGWELDPWKALGERSLHLHSHPKRLGGRVSSPRGHTMWGLRHFSQPVGLARLGMQVFMG
jgi:hypothetical protein